MEPRERIIVALDVDNLGDAVTLVRDLSPYVGMFKVGLELLTVEGSVEVVRTLLGEGAKIFYDGKFMDIPNTVAGASRAVASLGVSMFNVHASGGIEMMKAAVANKGGSKMLAVTVLTSFNDGDSRAIYSSEVSNRVAEFALLARDAGVDGVICSPRELKMLRGFPSLGRLVMVTPGVRPSWAAPGDQKRIMTPGEAIKAGADYLIIGRPITKPPAGVGTPVDAAKLIAKEIGEVLQ